MVATILTLLLSAARSEAITLNALYYASCSRELGVIIHVSQDEIAILTTQGTVKRMKRFDVIYLAQYPLGEVPISQISNADEISGIAIDTLYQDEITELVRGWPVNFSEKKVVFLSLDGRETIIDRDSIWDVSQVNFTPAQKLSAASKKQFEFVHPYPFSNCPVEQPEAGGEKIFPQQLLGNRLSIKEEFDRLKLGYEKITEYKDDRWFYPVPQIYSNATSLSIWYNYGSRHGKSRRRANSLVPALSSTLSEGPFGFQRELVTGSAPLWFSAHEEPQTQFYYRLKADYIHFSYFYDFDRLLVGEEQYKWRLKDLDTYDDRVNDVHHLAGGFDYGAYALGLSFSTLQYGVRHEDSFFVHRADYNQFEASYEDRKLKFVLYYTNFEDTKGETPGRGNGRDEPEEIEKAREALARKEQLKPDFKGKFRIIRANLDLKGFALAPTVSLISRELRFYIAEDANQNNEITYASNSLTGAVYIRHRLDPDVGVSAYVALEHLRARSGRSFYSHDTKKSFPKAGINWSLTF